MDKEISLIDQVSGLMSSQSVRDSIESLESELKKYPQVDVPFSDHYFGGIYARAVCIPKGTLLTGKIYKDDHFDIMLSGDITVSSDDGVKRLKGFNIFDGKQGKKRAGIAHEDTFWITFCQSEYRQSGDYLDHLTVESFKELDDELCNRNPYIDEVEIKQAFIRGSGYKQSDYEAFRSGYLAASNLPSKIDADREDYQSVLVEYGFTEDVARSQSEDTDDQIDIDHDLIIKPSDIEGMGLFSDKLIKNHDIIMVARIDGNRTVAGRYTNHSIDPNAVMVMRNGDIDLVAIKDIENEEITVDYRICLGLQIRKVA